MPGIDEMLVIFVLILLLFGPERLPDFARSIGRALRQIRKLSDEVRDQFRLDDD